MKLGYKQYWHFIIIGKTESEGGLPEQAGDWRKGKAQESENHINKNTGTSSITY